MPKGARDSWSCLLANVLALVHCNPFSYEAWRKHFMLPKCILFSSFCRTSSHWSESVKSFKQRIRCWFSGDLVCLRSEVQTVEARLNKRKTQFLYILRMPFELIKLSKMVNIKTPFSFLLLVVLPSCVIWKVCIRFCWCSLVWLVLVEGFFAYLTWWFGIHEASNHAK